MRSRAAVVDAVARLQLVNVSAELELDISRQDDQELLRVPVRVWLLSGRAADVQVADEDLEVLQRAWGEQPLRTEDPEPKGRTIIATENPGLRRPARIEQVGDAHTERAGDPPERRDARAGSAPLDLAQKTFADPGALGDRSKRRAPKAPNVPQALADIDFGSSFGRAGRDQISLDPVEGKLKRPYGLDEAVSTAYSLRTLKPLRLFKRRGRGPVRVASPLGRPKGWSSPVACLFARNHPRSC